MTTITFENCVTGDRHMVKAVERGGLALHAAATINTTDGTLHWQNWNVTHVQSGMMILQCRSVWRARRALRSLNAIGAWDFAIPLLFDKPDLSALPALFEEHARTIQRELGENPYEQSL